MGFKCNLNFALQIFSICAGVFGVIMGIVMIFEYFSIPSVILDAFVIFFSLCIIFSEVYVFQFFKYIAFIITFWGKAILYLSMGFFLFSTHGIGLVAAIIFWALTVFYIIVAIITRSASPPILQKNKQPEFESTDADYFHST